jgi:hypothetical protein
MKKESETQLKIKGYKGGIAVSGENDQPLNLEELMKITNGKSVREIIEQFNSGDKESNQSQN